MSQRFTRVMACVHAGSMPCKAARPAPSLVHTPAPARHRQHPPHHSGPLCLGSTAAAIKIHSCPRFIHQRWRLISSNSAPRRRWHRHCLNARTANGGRVAARCNGGLGEQDVGVFMECGAAASSRRIPCRRFFLACLARARGVLPARALLHCIAPCSDFVNSSGPAMRPRCGHRFSTLVFHARSG